MTHVHDSTGQTLQSYDNSEGNFGLPKCKAILAPTGTQGWSHTREPCLPQHWTVGA